MDAKEVAARAALAYVQDGMKLGLGTGSTAAHFLRLLGERVRNERLQVVGVPTSDRSREMALEAGIPLCDLADVGALDLGVDGADETDPDLNVIKGGGGALVREKLVASACKEFIIVCDSSKIKTQLGAFPVPVAILPFAWQTTQRRLETLGNKAVLRMTESGTPYVTDDGLYILDIHFGQIANAPETACRMKAMVGVVEVGLFIGMATKVIAGYEDGHVQEYNRKATV
ncbi:MAG: ribose-5-phosphate isomerase [Chthonomonadaceae bacterium]|nr:ribose-5-phosphate isomerase [Chthonomonadaceae bacterium]